MVFIYFIIGVKTIKKEIIERVKSTANYILNSKETIRQVSKKYNVSKSTVHKDLSERLKEIDEDVYKEVKKLMNNHISIRHLRGGESTRKRYLKVTEK